MGSAALYHLACRGHSVTGLEQYELGHDRGSSHGGSRVVRQAYFEHPDYVPLLKRAFALWEEVESDTGFDILHRAGVLILGGPDSTAIRRSAESAALHDIAVERLSRDELAGRFGQFAVPQDYHGLLEPGGGFVIPEHGNAGHIDGAKRRGAVVRSGVTVRSISQDGGGMRVETSDGSLLADHVVVTAGAWTSALIPILRTALQPQRQVLVWFAPRDAAACASDQMPAWLVDDGGARGRGVYYGVPTWTGQVGPAGVKVGFHGPGAPIEPGDPGVVAPGELSRFQGHMAELVPPLGSPTASTTCLYTMTPDEHFVIGAVDIPGITVAAGFSGHGYKFASAVGEVLADLTQGERRPDVEFLSPARFR